MHPDKDCGPLTPDSLVPGIRKYAGKKMSEVSKRTWAFLWFQAGYGKFGERRGWPGRLADYMEENCGCWQTPRPKWKYDDEGGDAM